MEIVFFKDINLESLQDYYHIAIDFEDRKLDLDLNFENTSINEDKFNQTVTILENLKESIDKVKGFINNDRQTGVDTVDEYLIFHLEELNEEELELILKDADKTLNKREQLLSILKLERIGFYPEVENEYAIFDFAINQDFSQYLLVVKLNKDGELDQITMES
jgi:Protein of unknown function (DUF2004)